MKAIVHDQYGPPEVLRVEEVDKPEPKPDEVLIEVRATSVTTAVWRFRTATFPPGMRLIGRLFSGLLRPRNRIPGHDFAGRVVEVGANVTEYRPGDDVFGASTRGATAEFITMPSDGALAKMPSGLSHAEAAALPFGGITALYFLEDLAKVKAGERVLVMGASGGVGVYAVQFAKHLGAEVTGVCSTANVELVRSLGADHVIDYTREDPRALGRMWDVIIDPVGKTTFAGYSPYLSQAGRHAFIEGRVLEIWQSLTSRFRAGKKVVFGVSTDDRAGFDRLRQAVTEGGIRPVIGHRFPLEHTIEAHRIVDGRHRKGAVIVEIGQAAARLATCSTSRSGPRRGSRLAALSSMVHMWVHLRNGVLFRRRRPPSSATS